MTGLCQSLVSTNQIGNFGQVKLKIPFPLQIYFYRLLLCEFEFLKTLNVITNDLE